MGTISIWIPLIVFSILLMDQEARGAQVPKYLQNKYGTKSVTSGQTTGASKSYSKTVTKTAEGVTKSKASSSSKSITSEPMDYTKKQMGNTGKKVISFQGGCTSMPSPMSAGVRCSQFSGCRADCLPNYQFPNGKTNIRLNCENGQWVDINGEFSGVPNCEPICMPPCQNNGICLQPNQCSCPENFSGPQCQFENKPCLNYPPMPKSSRRSCSSKKCTISCMDGHEFPDGSQIATMDCKNGMWVPSKEKWVSIPDCQAKCDPPCENGGNCLSFNVCQCPQEYRGPQCQYSADACSPKLLDFNGGYNCSGDGETFSCSLHCPPGIEFEFPAESVYTCTYAVGFFLPAPIPDCVYPEFSEVIFNGGSSETVYMTNETDISASDRKRIEHFLQHSNLSSEVENILNLHGEEEIITSNNGKILENGIDQIKNLVIETKAPTPGTCFSWGGSHYKTFDNRVYSFKSECPHVLLRDSKDGTFSIITDNGANCYQNPENCNKTIYVYFQNAKYVFSKLNDILTFKSGEKTLPIPGRVPGVRVEMSAHNLLVSLDTLGVKLLWDGQLNLQISVKENLWNRTEGLCGVLDGDPKTDLLTQEGIYPKNIMTLALSWRVDSDNKQCNSIPTEDPMCTINANRTNQADEFCNKLIADPKFKLCHDVMDITSLYEACRSDYCNCHATDPTVCSCQTFNVYVQHCKHFGITGLTNWRNDQTCPLRCANGKVYKSCENTSRQPACGSISEGFIKADSSCVEGCFCPEGTVLHEDKCITVDQCPCMLRGKSFKPFASVPKDCNTCTCVNGQWTCTQVDCGARCSAIGDPHYVTFDGKKYDFMGKCSYYLVKTTNFSIEAENVPCAGAISEAMNFPYSIISGLPTCTKTVTIRINDQVIKLKQNHDLVVNGEDITKVPFTIAGIRIKKVSSLFLLTTLSNNIKVWWDGSNRVYIDLPAKFKEQTRGLCGSFNNNQKDDFLTPQDDIEQAVIPFANKWKTSEKCEDLPEAIPTHPCDKNIHKRSKAESYCSKIKAELFKDCHFFVDPDQFYQDCMYDMCSCELPVSKCLCPIIAGYATECSQKGISVDWRSDVRECGVHCPGGQKYQVCGNSCTRTCQDISEEPDCKPQCIEGCNCPEGQTLDNDGQCIPISHCKCTYRGLEFPPGYKEIRPAPKAPELCTCTNAVWECSEADDVDKKLYPSADLLQNRCNASANMEFTTCEPVEPITCKNMHSPELYSPAVCHAGCQCKEGYVLDTTTKTCVKPTQCPCHHANKSYKENAVVQSGCNTCTCKHGKWSCTDRQCAAECSVWGDSHYKTFDGRRFDYQGECDYVLAKGSLGTDSFHVSVQNVPCGTLGTACFRSVTLKVTSGDGIDIVTLEKDKKLPSIKSFKHITIREKGNFVIVEAPELGLVIHWDRGTRVYVRLHPRWKDKTKGLCGNYNNNELDDFQTPSGGLAEVSSNIFGDSWRLQSYCTEAPEIQDTCSSRPERKMWAANKCGILKSSVFAACHYEVPVQYFYEKCVFDTCACDQGGDCECLCTALAAYAQECNNRGVAIKWRTPDFCPMQCDERCTRYHPCITTCPEETCDNLLTNKKYSKNCGEDVCIEGCAPKPCAPGMVYRNSSHSECVPIKDCRPICMIIDNVIYYEGDLIEEDDCHSCYCSREEKKCRGQPCTTTTIPTKATTLQMEQIIQCDQGWTQWINQDKPSDKEEIRYTEIEPVPSSLVLIRLKDSAKCDPEMITSIDCRTVVGHKTPKETGLDVECSLERGLVCKSNNKTQPCPDFEIRVLCDCGVTTTTEAEIITTKAPTCIVGESKEDDDDCTKYYVCAFGTVDNHWVEETCAKDNLYNPIKKACDWPKEVLSIRKCKITTIQPSTTIPTTTYKPTTVFELITTQAPECIAGEKKEDDNDCSKYYTCVSDGLGLRWIQDTCVEPKLYNPVKKICDKPEYVVKVRPTCKFSTTETTTEILFTQAPSCILGETKEDDSDCSKYYVCGPGLEENNWVSKTCGPNTFYNSITKVCDWIDKVVEVRPACKQEVTEAPKPICPSGTVYDKCAVQCNKLCLYYDHLVKKKGLCRGNVKCEEGCVTAERTKTCPKGSLWLNENTCVQIESCMCVSEDGKPMKPGKVYDERDCKKCQCINNAYSCQPGICTTKNVLSQATEIDETSGTNKKTKTTAPTEVTEEVLTKTPTKKVESSTTKKTKTAPTEGTTEEEITTTTKKHKTAPTEGSETEEITTTTKKHKTAPTEGTETEEVTTTTKKHKTAPTEGIEGETRKTTKKHKTAPTEGTETEEVTTTTKKHKTSPTEGTETEEVTTTTKKHRTAATEGTEPTEEVFTKKSTKKIETSPTASGTSAIPTVTSSGKCRKDRYVPLIQGDSPLPDSAFNASSVKEDMFAPKYARFNGEVSEEAGGSWAPSERNQNQWLEINLGKQKLVYGVIIKGSPVFDEYVTSYRVLYSSDGHNFYYILDRTTKQPVVFKGSTDSTTEVKQYFDVPVEARIIRINPRSWNNEIALQVELVGCAEPTTETTRLFTTTTPRIIVKSTPSIQICDDPMGLDDKTMSLSQVYVSSSIALNHRKGHLRLSDKYGWQPLTNSPTEWILFDFLDTRDVTGLVTKGGPDGWVENYIIQYSNNKKEWNTIMYGKNEKVFAGNYDSNFPQVNNFDLPIRTRYFKIIPKKWHNNIQMRVELHGCYKPYPPPKSTEEPTTTLSSKEFECNYCPGVLDKSLEMDACRCLAELWWDGHKCVNRTQCPCYVGYMQYTVGAVYEDEDCSECICKIGGVPFCTPKKCEPCAPGLKSTVTTTCSCTCQPCPTGTTLCPTSNICINSTLWCNGIEDCSDDEIDCTTTTSTNTTPVPTTTTTRTASKKETSAAATTTTNTPKISTTTKTVKCREVICGSGFKKVLKSKNTSRNSKNKYMSQMIRNNGKTTKSKYAGIKGKPVKKTPPKKWTLSTPAPALGVRNALPKEECIEYICVPVIPYTNTSSEALTICPSVECPEGYILVLEESSDKICQEFNCALPPKPDAVCKITGRTFKTFDGVEFKYDICNHVLARDLQYDEWEISLKKSCREVCSRDLIIQHDWQQFVFHPDFTVEFDGYTYSLDQAIKLAERQADFSITLIGNTVLFTSSKYGFWIIWDHNGDVKIGVDQQLNEKVDGLCGYFDGQQEGDKRKPDGSLSKTTVDFGDSWALSHDQPQICQAKVCPIGMQNKAWAICNNVKEKSLSKCGAEIDVEAFVSRCLENTCNCLQQSISINDTLKENCKCKALESFVGDCLSKNPSLDISNWRIEQNCPAPCDAPLIYHDCYQRRCEPDCATFSDSEACPKIKNMCFPGCYCPAGYVREGNNCVQPSSCKNCECTLLPYLDYITYDENKFTVNGNCTYVMSRDLITSQNKEHQFQVLITNQECQKTYSNKGEGKGRDNQMCVGKVTILYEKHKIHIIKDDLRNSLKIIFDGERVQDFSEFEQVIRVQETSRRDLKILLKRLLVSVHIYYPSLGVKLNVPSYTLAEKMEGICGDCNGRSADDFRTPDGKKPKDENDFGLNWLYEGLPGGQSRDQCGEKKEDKCEIKPGEVDPCEQLLDENKFGQCANLLDPTKYVEWCRKQTCGGDPKDSCEILENYALECSKLGICVNWRNNLCPAKDCPPGLFYSPCGPSHPKTCDDVEDIKNPTDVQKKNTNIPTEGCFCAKGKILYNGTCINPRECYTCDDEGHHPGDVWNKDKCTTCKCNKDKLICEKQQCIDPSSICERGYNAVKVPTGDEECCDKYTCVTEPTFAPVCDPPQNLQCAADQVLKLETKSNGCQVYICECRPKEECKEVNLSSTGLEPGYIKEVDYNSSCCPVVNLKCNKETCPPAKSCPQFYSLKIVESKCCPVYSCEAPEKCIVETEYGPASDGGERPLAPLEKQKLLKELNETWTDGPCRDCKCIVSDQGNFVPSCSKATCPDFQKESDWEDYELVPEKVYNECCPKFKRNACKYNGKLYQIGETWYKENDKCTSFSCVKSDTGYVQKQTQIKHCEETCDVGFAYIHPNVENECCGYCKQVSCVVNGQIVPIGKTWLSTDFCTESICLDQNGTILVKSKTKYCPKISEDILKEFIVEEIPQEGECCPKQVMNACRVGDVVVKIGETVPSPTDKCRTFTCVEKGPNELSIQETIRSCKTDCGKGWEYQKSENSCCGTCVQISCVLEGEIWKEGETWKSPDKCTTFSCEKLGDHYSIVTQQETCPSLEDCPKENIYTKGCCQYCNTTAEALTQCMPLAMELEDTIGIVKINDCKNKYPIANFTECVGNCESATAFNIGTGMHVSQCACCQALDYTSIVVELECEGGNKLEKKIAVPTKCGCNVKECEGFVKTTSIKSFTSPTQHSYTPTKSGRHSREWVAFK